MLSVSSVDFMTLCPECFEQIGENNYCSSCEIWVVQNSEFSFTNNTCSFCNEYSVLSLKEMVDKVSEDLHSEEEWSKKLVHPIVESEKTPTDERTISWVLVASGVVAIFLIPNGNAAGYIVATLLIIGGVWTGLGNSNKLDEAKLHNQYVIGASSVVSECRTYLISKSICLSCDRLQIASGITLEKYWESQLSGVFGLLRNTSNNKLVFHDGWIAAREYQ